MKILLTNTIFGELSLGNMGKLICVPVGPTASASRIKPYLVGVVTQAVVDLSGEETGKISLLKIIGNVLIMTTMETCAEINVFAEKTRLGVENTQKWTDNFPHAAAHTIYSSKIVNGDYYQKEVCVERILYSIIAVYVDFMRPMVEVIKTRLLTSQVLDLDKENNVSLKSYKVTVERLADMEYNAGSKEDICGIYGATRMESGMEFYNKGLKNGMANGKANGKNGTEKLL